MLPSDFHHEDYFALRHEAEIASIFEQASSRPDGLLYEYEAYELFELIGIKVPEFRYFPLHSSLASQIKTFMKPNQKYVIKCHIPGCLHKTDIGGIMLFKDRSNIEADLEPFVNKLKSAGHNLEGVIVVEMAKFYDSGMSNGELLISAFEDTGFGPCVCFGLGGTGVEYYKKVMRQGHSSIFLPSWINLANSTAAMAALERLPVSQFLLGKVRGSKRLISSIDQVVSPLSILQALLRHYCRNNATTKYVIREIEINPAVVEKETGNLLALDAVVRILPNPSYKAYATAEDAIPVYSAHKPLYKVGSLFAPQSVVIVGASTKSLTNPSTVVLRKLMEIPGIDVFCIHPTADEIFGRPCFKTVSDLLLFRTGKAIDLAVVGVAAKAAELVMNDLIDSNLCNSIFVLSGGFAETANGKEIEERLRTKLNSYGAAYNRTLVSGPNTLGFVWQDLVNTIFISSAKSSANEFYLESKSSTSDDVLTNLQTNIAFDDQGDLEVTKSKLTIKSSDVRIRSIASPNNNVALVCQSGASMITRMSNLAYKVRPLMSVSVGNQLCLSGTDFIEWLLTEDSASTYERNAISAGYTLDSRSLAKLKDLDAQKSLIRVIGVYMEGLNMNEGIRLMKLVAQARDLGKVIVIYKSGRTPQGSNAAAGHTASLAGDYSMFSELLDMAGAVVCDSFDSFDDVIYLASGIAPRIHRLREGFDAKGYVSVTALSNAGFECCCIADHLFELSTRSIDPCDERSRSYFRLPTYDSETKEAIKAIYEKYKIGAVVDVSDIIDTTPTIPDRAYQEIAEILLKSLSVDCAIFSAVPETHIIKTTAGNVGALIGENCVADEDSICRRFIALHANPEYSKPWVFVCDSGWKFHELRMEMMKHGVVVFEKADRASRALALLVRAYVGRDTIYMN
ncbi:ATP-dependent carboxylate-amine ligase, ATP-grasp domain protein [Giardia duodenalis]|uniref:ATP-dependent carboxylate-amine ligase, ATP-grasp domain protein n=1 Tax=Giardia intestinalis TaxID=5741 RepID=V6THC3_GIAIN|nr:ATP-dependent carboxylate-amine ligase, ATP-grasp domain protein [Giardia intestinalis]